MKKEAVENRGLDKDVFNAVCEGFTEQNCHQTLDLKLTYLAKGVAGIIMTPEPKYSTQGGRVHGGIIAVLADTVMGAAVSTINAQLYRTVEMNLSYLAPVLEEEELTGEARVIHPGNTIAVVEGSFFNNEGKLVAKTRATFIRDIKHHLYRG